MDNFWYFLIGFLLGGSSDSKSSKGFEGSPETMRIVLMITIPIVIILAIVMLRTVLSYQQ